MVQPQLHSTDREYSTNSNGIPSGSYDFQDGSSLDTERPNIDIPVLMQEEDGTTFTNASTPTETYTSRIDVISLFGTTATTTSVTFDNAYDVDLGFDGASIPEVGGPQADPPDPNMANYSSVSDPSANGAHVGSAPGAA